MNTTHRLIWKDNLSSNSCIWTIRIIINNGMLVFYFVFMFSDTRVIIEQQFFAILSYVLNWYFEVSFLSELYNFATRHAFSCFSYTHTYTYTKMCIHIKDKFTIAVAKNLQQQKSSMYTYVYKDSTPPRTPIETIGVQKSNIYSWNHKSIKYKMMIDLRYQNTFVWL